MRPAPSLALAALALAACGDQVADRPPPLDRFYYPTAIALRHLDGAGRPCSGGAAGCTTQLLVASSNFDLAYQASQGGTLLSVAVPDAPPAAAPGEAVPRVALDLRGAVRVGSLTGELAVVDASTCAGWDPAVVPSRTPLALVASRYDNALYRVRLRSPGAAADDLGLECGDDCVVRLDDRLGDPYGVGVACRGTGTAYQASAYVAYLVAPNGIGWLGKVDLRGKEKPLGPDPLEALTVQVASAQSLSYEPQSDRLWFTGRFVGAGFMPFRYLELGNPVAPPRVIDLARLLRGSETRGFSLSTDRQRAYVALRLFDADTAQRFGVRPPDSGGALGIIDLSPGSDGSPRGALVAAVPLGRSPGEVRVVPRPGRRDLVLATCTGDDSVWLYDDDTETVAKVLGADSLGRPALGKMPYALAVEPRADGTWRAHVAAFDTSVVTVFEIPDPATPASARVLMQLGSPRP